MCTLSIRQIGGDYIVVGRNYEVIDQNPQPQDNIKCSWVWHLYDFAVGALFYSKLILDKISNILDQTNLA